MKKILGTFLLLTTSAMATISGVDKQNFPNFPLISNPGFENGRQGWASSGATIAEATSGSNLLFGAKSLTMDASAGSQYLQTALVSIPVGLQGKNCLASMEYKGGDSNLTFQVLDGSANVLASSVLSAQTVSTNLPLNFICPSSGTLRLKILSGADAAIVAVDQFYLGDAANLTNVGQASLYGMANWTAQASCLWSTTSSSYGNYSADADCTTPVGANLAGNASAPATKVPGITFASLPAGDYYIVFTGSLYKNLSNADNCYFRLNDGTNSSYGEHQTASNGVANSFNTISGRFVYTSAQSNLTFQIQGKNNGTTGCAVDAREVATTFLVYRYPTSSELAYRPDVMNWKVDANIAGANPSLGVSAVTSYTSITNGSLTLTNNAGLGNISAQIPCSSTNAPTGTTCSSGTEDVGVSFVLPAASDVRACVSTGHIINNGAGGSVFTAFQIVETPNNAQTISQEGKDRPQSSSSAASSTTTMPLKVCGIFSFSSAGQKTLRLMYEQGVGGTVTASELTGDASSSAGQRDIHWEVYPITQSLPMPILVGGVTSNTSGQLRFEHAKFVCSGSSAITTQSGSWITSVGNVGGGTCIVNIAAGIFSSTPTCTASLNHPSSSAYLMGTTVQGQSAIRVDVSTTYINTGSATVVNAINDHYNLICVGPR